MGFNRISMGIQDFNPEVQKSSDVFSRMNKPETCSSCAVPRFRIDQYRPNLRASAANPESFLDSVEKVIGLHPDAWQCSAMPMYRG